MPDPSSVTSGFGDVPKVDSSSPEPVKGVSLIVVPSLIMVS